MSIEKFSKILFWDKTIEPLNIFLDEMTLWCYKAQKIYLESLEIREFYIGVISRSQTTMSNHRIFVKKLRTSLHSVDYILISLEIEESQPCKIKQSQAFSENKGMPSFHWLKTVMWLRDMLTSKTVFYVR